MRAFARVVAERDTLGGTRLTVLRSESPLLLRRTGPATVHLVGGGAGPLRGDDLRLDIEVGPGATLEIRSVAAQLALPGQAHLQPSRFLINATVAPGGSLRWLPEPLIAAAGCDHGTVTRVEVAAGGSLLWRDDLVCGRHNEPSGNAVQNTTIRYAGRTLHRHDLSVGPAAPGWSEAAVLGGGRALGTLVSTPAALPAAAGPGDFAVMPLAGPGSLATAVGADIRTVRAALDPLCEPRPQATPGPPSEPRPRPLGNTSPQPVG
ncbi:urease accessory protein UreD [Paractinoplanes brasiliensis]|uniref:Urease accessory protein UreD n=1 Tax=Paractinoplanes brasiliensis TaxID=52695 RepID=A0A4R6K308_9ACTN|nr:urease accessory protein UreD [Actinoplanes brasiliensis]TDO41575.1 urease accessory protein [Actinoplanes brasiliensis]GID27138.1 urease accessory protein UreD [Actinoplanes brasiliensis]